MVSHTAHHGVPARTRVEERVEERESEKSSSAEQLPALK